MTTENLNKQTKTMIRIKTKEIGNNGFTPLNLLYIVLMGGVIWLAVMNHINYKREVKHKIEMHKLNIEKVKIEIEILKKDRGH
jgi:hypothetical protein